MNKYQLKLIILSFVFIISSVSYALSASATATGAANDLSGFKFGVALGVALDQGDEDPVEKAQVVNGIIRVDKDNETVARFMLETHFFFKTDLKFLGEVDEKNWGHGPFVAFQPGSNNSLIDSVGIGWMIGFKRSDSSNSWNFGVGVIVDPDAQILGDGLKANQPLPEGETNIRYKTTDQWGALFLTSCTF